MSILYYTDRGQCRFMVTDKICFRLAKKNVLLLWHRSVPFYGDREQYPFLSDKNLSQNLNISLDMSSNLNKNKVVFLFVYIRMLIKHNGIINTLLSEWSLAQSLSPPSADSFRPWRRELCPLTHIRSITVNYYWPAFYPIGPNRIYGFVKMRGQKDLKSMKNGVNWIENWGENWYKKLKIW